MRTERWRKIVSSQLYDVAGWQFLGRMCYRLPVTWVLCGVLGESSAHAKSTYVWSVRMPLFIPTDVVDLTYSQRIAGSPFDDTDVEGLSEAIDMCVETCGRNNPLHDLAGFDSRKNWAAMETRAYANILLGRLDEAADLLKVVSSQEWELDWEGEIVSRATAMLAHLAKRKADAAMETLHQYRVASCDALGIPRPSDA